MSVLEIEFAPSTSTHRPKPASLDYKVPTACFESLTLRAHSYFIRFEKLSAMRALIEEPFMSRDA